MARPRRPLSRGASFVQLLWRTPLLAVPFGVFFSLLNGSFRHFGLLYLVALILAYTNAFAAWVVGIFLEGRRERAAAAAGTGRSGAAGRRGSAIAAEVSLYVGAVVLGSAAGSIVIRATLVPSFLGSARDVAVMLTYALLFCAVFLGVSYAIHFYGDALARARAEEEMNLARRIQRSFLLSSFPRRAGLEVHALNVSSKQCSGDFYDVVPVGERASLLCVADVSGKGVPAALLGSMLQASLRTQAPLLQPVGAMIANVNGLLRQGAGNGQFATMFLGRIDEDRMTLQYVNAGHNPPLLLRSDGSRQLLEVGGPMVGILDDVPYQQGEVPLAPGDRLVLYTDGVSEAMNAAQEMYGDGRVLDLAASLPREETAAQTIDSILAALRDFLAGEEPQDDMTLMVVRVLGPEAAAAGARGAGAGEAALPPAETAAALLPGGRT